MVLGRRASRIGVLACSLIAVAAGLGAGASGCGESESPAGAAAPGADGATTAAEGGAAPGDSAVVAPVTIDIVVASATVYAGQLAQLIATQSKASDGSGLNFGWQIKTVPQGSAITTSSIQGSNELVSFTPDLAGDYVITVTATTGAITTTKDVTVKSVNAPIFYVRTTTGTHIDDLGYEMHHVAMDGTDDHAVACRQATFSQVPSEFVGDGGLVDFGDAGDSGVGQLGMVNYLYLSFFADQALDWWEAPAGQPSRAAFQDFTPIGNDAGKDAATDAATSKVSLFVATQDNSCQNPPFAARSFFGHGGDGVFQPKFSPDGRRIAFVEIRDDKAVLVTTAIDGSDSRTIASICPDGGKECFKQYLFPRRPQWLDETHVGWMRSTTELSETSIGWEIMVATDIPSATPSRYLTCTSGAAPLLFNFLRDGNILTTVAASRRGAENLVILSRNAAGSCQVAKKLTDLTFDGAYARDFAISPDGKNVAYVHNAGGPPKDAGNLEIKQGGVLYTVPLDGSRAPAPLGPLPRLANYGPRYIAGGTRLAWNGMAPAPVGYDAGFGLDDAGVGDSGPKLVLDGGLPAITVIQADGGGFATVATGDPLSGSYVLGGGNGGSCSMECNGLGCTPQCDPKANCAVVEERRGGSGAAFWASVFALGFAARRARRRR